MTKATEMNPRQRIVLAAGAVVIVALGLFPPWREKADIPYKVHFEKALGHHFIASPPSSTLTGQPRLSYLRNETTIQVDLSRLFIEWVVVGVMTTVLFLFLSTRIQNK